MPTELTQRHFRFRTDGNAVDAAPTWGANEDDNSFNPNANNFRMRIQIGETETYYELREDLSLELREDGSIELRE